MSSESYRHIVRSPDIRGGNARVENTRIAVHDVVGLLKNNSHATSSNARYADFDECVRRSLYKTVSRPFDKSDSGKIAMKGINH
jgi:uncharacterized protein (DUF433 family)